MVFFQKEREVNGFVFFSKFNCVTIGCVFGLIMVNPLLYSQ